MGQQVWEGNPSEFPWEQEGLNHIKNCLDALPIPYYARQCFTFTARNGAVRECDLLIAVPAGFFLLELKAHRGRARNVGSTWSFEGDSTINNPLHATDQKAKELKGLLQQVNGGSKIDIPFLDAAVFLSAPDLVCDSDFSLRLDHESTTGALSKALRDVELVPPIPDPRAVNGLKFNDALSEDLAAATLAARLADRSGAAETLRSRRRFATS